MYKDFSEPSLRAGIDLLRDSTQWPEGFTWNYANSCRCAMGLFRDTWDQAGMPVSTRTSALLGIEEDKGGKIFNGAAFAGRAFERITAEDVASKLEELIDA